MNQQGIVRDQQRTVRDQQATREVITCHPIKDYDGESRYVTGVITEAVVLYCIFDSVTKMHCAEIIVSNPCPS
jgi:hypothetical protein